MMEYLEPDMEINIFEYDTVRCSNIVGNEGPGDNGGDSYDDWVNM